MDRRDRFMGVATMAAGIAVERTEEAQRTATARLATMATPDELDAMIEAGLTFDDEIDMEGIEIPVTFGDEQ